MKKGINYILNKNFDLAKKECNDSSMFKVKCHPHIIRHSKAIHLLDCNVDIMLSKLWHILVKKICHNFIVPNFHI